MTGLDRADVVWWRLRLFAICCTAPLLLSGCTGFKQALGIERASPDEFAVESRAPLTIPPEFNLRPPQPGAPRPQERTAGQLAREAIDTAGPGQPGQQASGLPRPGVVGGETADPNQQLGANSLARKLLTSADISTGVSIDKRQTSVLKDVY
jgi:hypothetical protein